MALIKIGNAFVNGQEQPVYLLQGNAVRDSEVKEDKKGKPFAKVSVAAVELQDGETTFVTVCGWRSRAQDVSAIKKMDSVLAIGVLKSREYKERTYFDLDADFVAISGVSIGSPTSFYGGAPDGDFAEITEEDGELPF